MQIESENYKTLVDRAEGAYLRRDFLEAFLVQSCLVEGVLKGYCQSKLSYATSQNSKFKERISSADWSRLIDILFSAAAIDTTLYEKLQKYRKSRNKVIHSLLEYEDKVRLDDELKQAYELGRDMKGYIIESMLQQTPEGTVAELEAQLESLIGEIAMLQNEMQKIDPDFAKRFKKMWQSDE